MSPITNLELDPHAYRLRQTWQAIGTQQDNGRWLYKPTAGADKWSIYPTAEGRAGNIVVVRLTGADMTTLDTGPNASLQKIEAGSSTTAAFRITGDNNALIMPNSVASIILYEVTLLASRADYDRLRTTGMWTFAGDTMPLN